MQPPLNSLTPADLGVFRILTRSSEHVWDTRDGRIRWQRIPGQGKAGKTPAEAGPVTIARVLFWPAVHSVLFVAFYDEGGTEMLFKSGQIRAIHRVE
jgi:hypothetical protein